MCRNILILLILSMLMFFGCSQAVPATPSVTPQFSPVTLAPVDEPLSVPVPETLAITPPPLSITPASATPTLVHTAAPVPVVTTPVNLPPPLPSMEAFMKGIWFNDQPWALDKPRPPMYGPMYFPPQTDPSLKSLATTGANWIAVVVHLFQETITSTNITRHQYGTAPDIALRQVIELAHSLGIRVALVPGIDFSSGLNQNWTLIGMYYNEPQWQEWFASYREHINHYASLSQDAGADMFYVGSELTGTTHRENDWRRIVKEVRERYKGPISYDSLGGLADLPNHEVERIQWWDAVDFIAADFWRPLTYKNDPTVEELKKAWINTGYLRTLEALSIQFKKPVILSEIGYDSHDGTNRDPGGKSIKAMPEDLQEQADCYRAALEVMWGKPWLKGIFWWQWNAISTPWSGDPHGKPAEDVLREFYLTK